MASFLFRARAGACVVLACLGIAMTAGLLAAPSDAATNQHPFGQLYGVTKETDGLSVFGYAIDPNGPKTALKTRITDNGKLVSSPLANVTSPSVAKQYPADGGAHAFHVHLTEAAGSHQLCLSAQDYPSTTSYVQIFCATIQVAYNPFGKITSSKQTPGKLTIAGYAIDPDALTTPLHVSVSVDGKAFWSGTASGSSATAVAAYPAAGKVHGFAAGVAVKQGTHTFCVTATNIGPGSTTTLPCVKLTANFSPTGAITSIHQAPLGKAIVTGWATDPDNTTAPAVKISVTGPHIFTATFTSVKASGTGHTFSTTQPLGAAIALSPGTYTFCATVSPTDSLGTATTLPCKTATFNWNPSVGIDAVQQQSPSVHITGWATDPDTTGAITAQLSVDGKAVGKPVAAGGTGGSHSGHSFSAVPAVNLANGSHTICATAINVHTGTGNSSQACSTITVNFSPVGALQTISREPAPNANEITVTGWAVDPNTTAPIKVTAWTSNGTVTKTVTANLPNTAGHSAYPALNPKPGYSITLPMTDQGEHWVCVNALNAPASSTVSGAGSTVRLGCKIMVALHPVAPSAPQSVSALAGYGAATVTWAAPASDGGAPWSKYTVTATPQSGTSAPVTLTTTATATSATVVGLASKTTYIVTVTATNLAGTSVAGMAAPTTTQVAPPPQTTPAPISTSRYIRNLNAATSSDLATMKAEGLADAKANPSGHGYLILLDIGGQDESRKGVLLTATAHYVSYPNLVTDLKSYIAGYASGQRASAPITIALGTNNDVDVSTSSGASWANNVVDPLVAYAHAFPGITIAGANDMEPGFSASYTQTRTWLQGYLGATTAPFVFNGSADGCSSTGTNHGCNNGWSSAGLDYLSGTAAPTRILGLPQVYFTTMAQQWRYISLTGVQASLPRINFGGALTEYTACQQAGSCSSMTGNSAWTQMWTQLRSDSKLTISSLPYSTDLRIDS